MGNFIEFKMCWNAYLSGEETMAEKQYLFLDCGRKSYLVRVILLEAFDSLKCREKFDSSTNAIVES